MNKPLAFHVGIGGSTEAEKRTCGNCWWWSTCTYNDKTTQSFCRIPIPNSTRFVDSKAEDDASHCPCWKVRE
jgi:hypothetical protein